ncbi:MAG: hypothetical protein J6J18_03300 [Oscillospiraceae bacterium]|nr:hypothetical protein [Oscillospiraceae bacterium]
MKKFISMLLALVMVFSLTACGSKAPAETEAPTEPAVSLEGTLEELLNQIVEQNPVEFMGGVIPVDVTDTSEDGLANLKYFTGLDSAEGITEAAVYEPMMGSIAFSMVMVRANTGVGTKSLAESMKAGIDQRKWICVEADDLLVCGFGDVVMLIMVASDSGMTAQSFVDAFQSVCASQFEGAELEFVI